MQDYWKMNKSIKYTVRRPMSSGKHLAVIVTKHRTLKGAITSLEGERRGARMQGGYSVDYIWDEQTKEPAIY